MASNDITFCTGIMQVKLSHEIEHEVECPIRNTCVRFVDQPHKGLHAYFVVAPWDFSKNECGNYWIIDREYKTKARKKK